MRTGDASSSAVTYDSHGRLTWGWLSSKESRLAALKARCESIRDPGPEASEKFCPYELWGGGFRNPKGLIEEFYPIVGFSRRRVLSHVTAERLLSTSGAWAVAYEEVFGSLPACRGCGCI